MAFTKIEILLSAPICGCRHQKLAWYITGPVEKPGLGVRCELCQVVLRVPNGEFKASFVLRTGYPEGLHPSDRPKEEPKAEPKDRLKVLDGGLAKVVPFAQPEEAKT